LTFAAGVPNLASMPTFPSWSALLPLALLFSSSAEAASTGESNHGAGGPFVRLGAWAAPELGEGPFLDLVAGGSGYSYHADGHLRLGGGGQGTNVSWALRPPQGTDARDLSGEISWGGLLVAWDPLSSSRWELPVGACVGGGSYQVSRVVGDGPPTLVETEGSAMMVVQGFTAVERRLARTLKATLQLDYLLGFHQGVAVSGGGLSLQATFLIPRAEDDIER